MKFSNLYIYWFQLRNSFSFFIIFFIHIYSYSQPYSFKNIWNNAPKEIPTRYSTDAPLLGNGDVLMTFGYQQNDVRFYISKNDFWRLQSKYGTPQNEFAYSGSRLVGYVDIKILQTNDKQFKCEQNIWNGKATSLVQQNLAITSWVCATQNLIFIEINTLKYDCSISINLSAPARSSAKLFSGKTNNIFWQTRSFTDSVDIQTSVSVAMKIINSSSHNILVKKGKPVYIVLSVESRFKQTDPLLYVINQCKKISVNSIHLYFQQHNNWWKNYWEKSSVMIDDSVLMKSYYQGLYTMAACCRDKKFPPGLFGWITTDTPAWNNDYHLNYNFEAPFYSLCSSNRLEQAEVYDAPIIDFIPRGKWYSTNVTHTRGVLYPVGIGPLGIEVTRQVDTLYTHEHPKDIEKGGMFWQQRSNTAYALVNMAQYWRCTYDKKYGKKIYPFALEVGNFWEDYLRYENGRYIIDGDAIHEGSGHDKNPVLSLGLIYNTFELLIDLSNELHINENRIAKWKYILDKLSPFPTQMRNGKKVFRYTEEGMAWNDGNGLGIQHIYPANAITLNSNKELVLTAQNTIDEMQRWLDGNTTNSFYVAAIRVGYKPDTVYNKLHQFTAHTKNNGFITVHGVENSCNVTNALNEMLCMSAGNVIRLFEGLPENINASFKNLRAWGAFLISAKRENKIISDVKIFSKKGKTLKMVNPWGIRKVQVYRNKKIAEKVNGTNIQINTSINESILLKPYEF